MHKPLLLYVNTYITGAAAFSNAFFGMGTGTILLDSLECTGTETRLVDCSHNGISNHNCFHVEDAGLRCAGMVTGKMLDISYKGQSIF